MAKLLLGKEVTDALNANLQTRTAALREKGIIPTLGIVRVGADPSDLSYEKGATKRAELVGVAVKNYVLPEDATKEQVLEVIDQVNADDAVHGVLMFRPLPKHLKADQNEICNRLVDKLITRHPHVFAAPDDEHVDGHAPQNAEDTLALWERMKQKEKQRTSVLEGISHAQGALPRTAKIVSRVAKSARHEQLEQAFEPETTGEHQYADAIIAAIRAAHHNGVDIEADLRCRLRDIEHAIETIEKEHPND